MAQLAGGPEPAIADLGAKLRPGPYRAFDVESDDAGHLIWTRLDHRRTFGMIALA
jgi:hypothetical protein